MNPRMTVALLVLCVAVGAYLYWVPAPNADTTASKTPKIQVTNIESQQVAVLEAVKNDGSVFRTSRDPQFGWMIEKPTKFPGDEVVIGPAVQGLAKLSATSVITPTSSDVSAYGLTKPSMTITLQDSAQKTLVTLLVGGTNPAGDAQYVKRSDDARIFLVGDINLSIIGTWFTATPLKPTALPTFIPATETPTKKP